MSMMTWLPSRPVVVAPCVLRWLKSPICDPHTRPHSGHRNWGASSGGPARRRACLFSLRSSRSAARAFSKWLSPWWHKDRHPCRLTCSCLTKVLGAHPPVQAIRMVVSSPRILRMVVLYALALQIHGRQPCVSDIHMALFAIHQAVRIFSAVCIFKTWKKKYSTYCIHGIEEV